MTVLSSPLNTLIEIAERATDEAAAKLGRAIRAREELDKKLTLLKNYRNDYAVKMQTELQAGRDMQHIRNFQLFLGKIDDAIKGQSQLVLNAQKQIQQEQTNWQEQEKKRVSFLTLEERAEKAEQKKEAKREQLLNDEHGIRQAHYRQ